MLGLRLGARIEPTLPDRFRWWGFIEKDCDCEAKEADGMDPGMYVWGLCAEDDNGGGQVVCGADGGVSYS